MVSRAFPYILDDANPKLKTGSRIFVGNCRESKINVNDGRIMRKCVNPACKHSFLVAKQDLETHTQFYCACCAAIPRA